MARLTDQGRLEAFGQPIYTAAEIDALRDFDRVVVQVRRETPRILGRVADVADTAPWHTLMAAAQETLHVVIRRGRHPVDLHGN